jgi:hypothetical protein
MPLGLHLIRWSPVRVRPGDFSSSSEGRATSSQQKICRVFWFGECGWNYIAKNEAVAGSNPARSGRLSAGAQW